MCFVLCMNENGLRCERRLVEVGIRFEWFLVGGGEIEDYNGDWDNRVV
jgi:hypothetical protein